MTPLIPLSVEPLKRKKGHAYLARKRTKSRQNDIKESSSTRIVTK